MTWVFINKQSPDDSEEALEWAANYNAKGCDDINLVEEAKNLDNTYAGMICFPFAHYVWFVFRISKTTKLADRLDDDCFKACKQLLVRAVVLVIFFGVPYVIQVYLTVEVLGS